MHITFRQLEIFQAVAQYGKVTIAAEKMALSQPAVSMALSELEKQLGPLFTRQHGFLTLNNNGALILPKVVALLDRGRLLEQQYKPLQADDSMPNNFRESTIYISASSTIGNYLMPDLMMQHRNINPTIRIELIIQNTHTITQQLLDLQIDLGLIEGECEHPDIAMTPWFEDELVIICHPQHPSANQVVDLSALGTENWILREAQSGTRQLFNQRIASQFNEVNTMISFNQIEAIKQGVMNGLGISCVSLLAVQQALELKQLAVITVTNMTLTRHFYLLTHKRRSRGIALESVCQFLLGLKEGKIALE